MAAVHGCRGGALLSQQPLELPLVPAWILHLQALKFPVTGMVAKMVEKQGPGAATSLANVVSFLPV